MKYQFLSVTLSLLLGACGDFDSSSSSGARVSTQAITEAANNPDDHYDTNSLQSSQSMPTLDRQLDPRASTATTLKPSPVIQHPQENPKIHTLWDGSNAQLPSCQNPIPFPDAFTLENMEIDGDLSEWPRNSIIGIDHAGDGAQPSQDLRTMYWGHDGASYYFAAEVQGDWETDGNDKTRIVLSLSPVSLPTSNSELPKATNGRTFEIIGNELWEDNDGYQEVPQGRAKGLMDYAIKTKGHSVELRIPKSAIDGVLAPAQAFSLDVFATDFQASFYDTVGPVVLGLEGDYSCLIPVSDPQNSSAGMIKLVHFSRSLDVRAEDAENIYRAVIAALPEIPIVTEDAFSLWDTISIQVIPQMGAAGLFLTDAGIFINSESVSYSGERGVSSHFFFVAAHELLHAYNVGQYQLPTNWAREGHSNAFALKALKRAFGAGAAQSFYLNDWTSFLSEEETYLGANRYIDDDSWGSFPYSPLYFYRKAAMLQNLLLATTDYDEYKEQILHALDIRSTDDFFARINNLFSFHSQGVSTLLSGWFEGDYEGWPEGLSFIEDSDGDGLSDFEEGRLKSDDGQIDSDQDGVSDIFESLADMDPLQAQEVSGIYVDNDLSEWSAQGLLPALQDASHRELGCDLGSWIGAARAYSNDGWVVVGMRTLQNPSKAAKLQVVVFVTLENGTMYQIIVPYQSTVGYLLIPDDLDPSKVKEQKSIQFIKAFNSQDLEIAFQKADLGLESDAPVSIQVANFEDSTQCDFTATAAPSAL